MPKAYQRVLQVGRVFLNRPKADDREVASSLLELDQANFAPVCPRGGDQQQQAPSLYRIQKDNLQTKSAKRLSF